MWKQHKLKIIIGAALLLLVAGMAIFACLPENTEGEVSASLSNPSESQMHSSGQTAPTVEESLLPEETVSTPSAGETDATTPTETAQTAVEDATQMTTASTTPTTAATTAPTQSTTQSTQQATEPPEPQQATCTISISCATALSSSSLPDSVRKILPSNGWILSTTTVALEDGDTVFSVLQRVTKSNGIQMESTWTAIYQSAYVEGIGNLYEFDCGELSGWMYSVNGWYASYGSSSYTVQDGDVIRWDYTCDLGADLG